MVIRNMIYSYKYLLATCIFLICGLFLIPQVQAVQTGSVVVTATVFSNVSGSLSTVTTNLSEIPSDGISSIMVTVKVIFVDGSLASNKDVVISSNRGNLDVFSVYHGDNLVVGNQGQTDVNGDIRFAVRSLAPGQSTLSVQADSINLANRPTVTFTPLPLLSNLLLSVKVPFVDKKVVILEPDSNKKNITLGGKLVNTQTELQISFMSLLFLFVILLSSPFLFVWLLIIYRRLKRLILQGEKYREKEDDFLSQIYNLEQKIAADQQLELTKDNQIFEAMGKPKKN